MGMVILFDDPVTLYRGRDMRVIHNQKQWEDAKKDGFMEYDEARRQYPDLFDFPKMLYHEHLTEQVVTTPDEEAILVEQGYRDVPFHTRAVKDKLEPVVAIPATPTHDAALESRISTLEATLSALVRILERQTPAEPEPAETGRAKRK